MALPAQLVPTMYSNPSSKLEMSELLAILKEDPDLRQSTKDKFGRLDKNSNPWRTEILRKWTNLRYPLYTEADIMMLNITRKDNVARINQVREHQRMFWISQGNQAAANLILDETSKAYSEKACLIRNGSKVEGYDPAVGKFVTVSNSTIPEMEKLKVYVEECEYSGAVNIPKSISNLLDEGELRGYSEECYKSLWLQFLKEYCRDSYATALSYSRDLNSLFQFLLSLVDTNAEIAKLRAALAAVTRKTTEPITIAANKLQSLSKTLLFMIQPDLNIEVGKQRAERSTIDGLYSLISENCKVQLSSWKRQCNAMGRTTSLADFLEAIGNIELDANNKPNRDYIVSSRMADVDIAANSFYATFGLKKPETRGNDDRKRKEARESYSLDRRNKSREPRREGRQRDSNNRGYSRDRKEPRDNRSSSRDRDRDQRSRNYDQSRDRGRRDNSRGRSPDRRGRDQENDKSQYRDRHRSGSDRRSQREGTYSDGKVKRGREERGREDNRYNEPSRKYSQIRSGSNNKAANLECKKCASTGHFARECPRYPFFYEDSCQKCEKRGAKLYHPTDLCRFSDSRYKTPPRKASPTSFRKESSLTQIFSKND